MATLPTDNEFNGSAVTEASFKSKYAQMLAYFRALLGSDGTAATAQTTLGIPDATNRLLNIEQIVGTDGTAATARQNLGLAALTLDYIDRGAWLTGTAYNTNDQVISAGVAYLCVASHTSTTFAADIGNGLWVIQQGLNNLTGVQVISSMVGLRQVSATVRRVLLSYHTNQAAGGGGRFYGVVGQTVGHFVDNNGTVIVPIGGDGSSAWIREDSNHVLLAEEFGILSDGATNDTIAMQQFIRAAKSGDTLRLKPGTCICDDLIPFNAPQGIFGVTIEGFGVTLKRLSVLYNTIIPTSNYALEFTGYHYLTIKGIVFARNNSLINIGGISGVHLLNSSHCKVIDCDVTECFWGVVTSGATAIDNKVIDCISNFSATYTASADTNRTFNEFIYRTFGDVSGSNHSHAAIGCYSNGSAMIFQPYLSPYSRACYNYSINSWGSPIYMASDDCFVMNNTVINAGKDGIKLNRLFDKVAISGGVIVGNIVNGCGIIRADGGQNISIASNDAVVTGNNISLSLIAGGAAPEQNGILIIGNNNVVSNNTIKGLNEGVAIHLRGRHYIDNSVTPAVNYSLGCAGNKASGNRCQNVAVAVKMSIPDNTLVCVDNDIQCDASNVTNAALVYSTLGTITDCSYSGKVVGVAVVAQLTGTLKFRLSSVHARLISNQLFSLNSCLTTIFTDVITDGSAPNNNAVDQLSSIDVFKNIREGNRFDVSQAFYTVAAGNIQSEGNTLLKTNGVNSALVLTNGSYIGQRKIITSDFISNGNTIVITGVFINAATTLTFATQGEFVELTWMGAFWLISTQSTVQAV